MSPTVNFQIILTAVAITLDVLEEKMGDEAAEGFKGIFIMNLLDYIEDMPELKQFRDYGDIELALESKTNTISARGNENGFQLLADTIYGVDSNPDLTSRFMNFNHLSLAINRYKEMIFDTFLNSQSLAGITFK
ncbi:MAG: hypothetical protein IPK62_15525 [Bacteroidetes bacterium]|nr:hypothetical protein [Bacteroidota bacterium]